MKESDYTTHTTDQWIEHIVLTLRKHGNHLNYGGNLHLGDSARRP